MTTLYALRAALNGALSPLTAHRQFIVYRLSQNDDGTLDKIPVNPASLHTASALDSSNWLDALGAVETVERENSRIGWKAYGAGFVLTESTGLWCVDVDNCIASDGALSPLASEACGYFQGAAVETSVSGRGVHIWGMGTVPPHANKYSSQYGKLELYTSHRFIALCGDDARGYAGYDFTPQIGAYAAHYFPPKAEDHVQLGIGPAKEWYGPTDDGELVAAAMMADPAQVIPPESDIVPDVTFGDLWTRNVEVLRRRYPPNKEGQQFDASEADLALARKLAYWTGRDVGRIERLMHMSGLVREKWQRRRGWITQTIVHAAKKCTQVYGEDNALAGLSQEQRDFYMERAKEFVKLLLKKKEERAQERFQLQSAQDFLSAPPLRWLVKGVLPQDGVAAMYGPSGSGKSFLAIDLAVAAASDEITEWFGRKIDTVPVAYLALEGARGVGKRLKAWQIANQKAFPDRLKFIDAHFDMTGKSNDVADLSTVLNNAGMRGGLIVIDTLSRAAPGMDENSSQEMSALIAKAAQLQRNTGGLVLLVHHTGKDGTKGLRGHSSLYAALDAAIEVQRDQEGGGRSWSIAKSKDDADGGYVPFDLGILQVGMDEDDAPITSCVVRPAAYGEGEARPAKQKQEEPPKERALGDHAQIAFDQLKMLLRTEPNNTVHPEYPCIHWTTYETKLKDLFDKLGVLPKNRASRIERALTQLLARNKIGTYTATDSNQFYYVVDRKHVVDFELQQPD